MVVGPAPGPVFFTALVSTACALGGGALLAVRKLGARGGFRTRTHSYIRGPNHSESRLAEKLMVTDNTVPKLVDQPQKIIVRR